MKFWRRLACLSLVLLGACGGGDEAANTGSGTSSIQPLDGTAEALATQGSETIALVGTTASGMQFSIPLWRTICKNITSYQSQTQREICESLAGSVQNPVQAGVLGTSSFQGVAWVGEPHEAEIPVSTADSRNTIRSIRIVNNTPGGAAPSVGPNGNMLWTPNPADFATRSLTVTVTPTVGDTETLEVPVAVGRKTQLHRIPVNSPGDYSDPEGDFILRVRYAGATVPANITIQQANLNSGASGFKYEIEPANSGTTVSVIQEPPITPEPLNSQSTSGANAANVDRKARQNVGIRELVLLYDKVTFYGTQFPGITGNLGSFNTWTSRQSHTIPWNSNDSPGFLSDPIARIVGSCKAAECRSQSTLMPPVIIIHGFRAGDNFLNGTGFVETDLQGGGEGAESTWGNLPNMLKANGHAVYDVKWQTYMRFEEAAGILSRATNYVYNETGKKPIIIAHSFGGIVAHAMSKGLGIIYNGNAWQQAAKHSAAKIITIASPLSGISSLPRNGLSIGRDADDISIGKCKAVTCLEAGDGLGATIPSSPIVGLYTRWIDPNHSISLGSTIRNLHAANLDVDHHVLAAYKWPLSSLPGGAWNNSRYPDGFDQKGLFGSDGDGLIHLLGQAVHPTDFMDLPDIVRDYRSFSVSPSKGEISKENKVYGSSSLLRGTVDGLAPCVNSGVYHICGELTHTSRQESQTSRAGYRSVPSAYIINEGHHFYTYLLDKRSTNSRYLMKVVPENPCDTANPPLVCKPKVNVTGSVKLGSVIANIQSSGAETIKRALLVSSDVPAAKVLVWAEFQHKITGETVRDTSSALTDADGRFDVDAGLILRERFGADVAIADYRAKLIVRVAGFETYLEVIENLAQGENTVGTLVLRPLTPLVSFSGRVLDGQTASTPIGGAVVRLALGRNLDAATILQKTEVNNIITLRTARKTTTNAAGQFALSEIRAGEYSVLVTKPGYRDQVQGRLTVSNNGQVSLSMLANPDLPLTVSQDTFIWWGGYDSGRGEGRNFNNESRLITCGFGWQSSGNGTAKSLLFFNHLQIPSTAKDVYLNLYHTGSDNNYDASVEVYRLDSSWTESGVTWNTQPSFDPTRNFGTLSIPPGNNYGWVRIPITNLVKQWQRNEATNFGLVLDSRLNGASGCRVFNSTAAGENRPYVSYTSADAVSPPAVLFDDFIGPTLDTSKWNVVGSAGGYNIGNSFLNVSQGTLLDTVGRVTFSGSKIVIEARMGGKEANIFLVDADAVGSPVYMMASNTGYGGWGLDIQPGPVSNITSVISGASLFSSGSYLVAGNGIYDDAIKFYRFTLDGSTLTLERGSELTAMSEKIVATSNISVTGRRLNLRISTGSGGPGTFDWIRVNATP